MRIRVLALLLGLLALPLVARADAHTQTFTCDGSQGIGAMENEYIAQTGYGDCWFHVGHHTYDSGALHRVGAVAGSVVSVEIMFSPTVEFDIRSVIPFEASPDGLRWTRLATISYRDRKTVEFSFDANGFEARYFRIRQPRSLARGLSGFLDSSRFTAELTPMPAGGIEPTAFTRALSCQTDVMERFFDEHPCMFGGINRYDSPSVFHTYPIGASMLDRVSGEVTFLPWRSDDYTQNGGHRSEIRGFVQISADAYHWTTITEVRGVYGTSIAFAVTIDPREASYVRLVAEYHKGVKVHPALKHARGMIAHSAVSVAGTRTA